MARVLLIEGEGEVRSALRSVFESAGHDVREATDTITGMPLFHQHAAQVVIITLIRDVRPGLSFIQTVAYEYTEVEIIALIDPDAKQVEVYARTFGAAQVFTKPVDPGTLLEAVEELIDEK